MTKERPALLAEQILLKCIQVRIQELLEEVDELMEDAELIQRRIDGKKKRPLPAHNG